MSNQRPDDNNDLLNFIAVTVETMRDQMVEMRDQMATKNDLERMATKSDLERMATKDDLKSLSNEVSYIGGEVETMRGQMATKSDLSRLESKMEVGFAAVRGDIEQVQLRVDSIERAIRARLENVETEISRLRSVLYLLVKDKPDMLRLLGQTPPAGEGGRV